MEISSNIIFDLYKACRVMLNTRHDCTVVFKNEVVQVTSLVMMLEDIDSTLELRFEAERAPRPIVKASKYDRAAVARNAHAYAKAMAGQISYRKRLATGFKIAWKEVTDSNFEMNVTHFVLGYDLISINEIKAAERWLKRTFVGRAAFEYDTLYYSEKYHTRTGTVIPQYA